jgi:transcriptional regulator with XRE-family HTH domain
VKINLRARREAAGLSVLELARRSGVARGTITALEAHGGNPTVDTLYALADTLGVPLADLLDEPGSTVLRAGEGVPVEGAALDARLLSRGRFGELYAISFHPGEVRHAQPHPFGVEEHLHLHAGRVRVGPEDAPLELAAGDYARFDGSVPHIYEALEPAHGTLLIASRS